MSAAFPDIKPQHTSVSPLLAEAVHENLAYFSKVNKTVLELIQEIGIVHDKAASSILSLTDTFRKKINDISKAKPQCNVESYMKFVQRLLEQYECQAKVLQNVSNSFNDCVVSPMQDVIEKKKEIWKTCSFYVGSFQQQIKQKEDDLVKRYKDYCDAAVKSKSAADGKSSDKQQLMYHNSHNTYLLRLSSVNSMNKLLYTHVLPYVLHSMEKNQGEINDSLRHHVKYMFSAQKDTLKKIIKSVDKIDHATEKIDLVGDLNKFVKALRNHTKDKSPQQHEFVSPTLNQQGRRSSLLLIEPLENCFIVNHSTQPNLKRRLAALQNQTEELVDNIASMRAAEREVDPRKDNNDPALTELIELLSICDKEANLNVLLKQMELYTPTITDYLGPISSKKTHSVKGGDASVSQIPHTFTKLRSMKPLHCFYCQKITTFGKSYICKLCKMPVHKKCATNVPFCEGRVVRSPQGSMTTPSMKPIAESAEVYDLIDLESDDDYLYDDDEFDDGLSSDEEEQNVSLPRTHTSSQYKSNVERMPSLPLKPLPKEPIEPPPPATPTRTPISSNVTKPKVTKKPSTPLKPTIAKKPSLPAKPAVVDSVKKCVALYDYRSTDSTELSFIAGSTIDVIESKGSDWWRGKFNGFEGYFPCTYVVPISTRDRVLRVLYSFTAQTAKELTVMEGDILILIEDEEDWLKVKLGNSEGLVPSSYVSYL